MKCMGRNFGLWAAGSDLPPGMLRSVVTLPRLGRAQGSKVTPHPHGSQVTSDLVQHTWNPPTGLDVLLQLQDVKLLETELKHVQLGKISKLHSIFTRVVFTRVVKDYSVFCSSWVLVQDCIKSWSPTETYRLVVFLVSLLQFDRESTEELVTRCLKRLQLHTAVFFFYAKRIVRAKPHGNAFHTSRHINTIAGNKFPPRLLRSVLRVCVYLREKEKKEGMEREGEGGRDRERGSEGGRENETAKSLSGEMLYLLRTTSQGHSGGQIKLLPTSEGVTQYVYTYTHTHILLYSHRTHSYYTS